MKFDGSEYIVEEVKEDRYAKETVLFEICLSFKDIDVALFSAGGSISKKFGPIAADSGSIVKPNFEKKTKKTFQGCGQQFCISNDG